MATLRQSAPKDSQMALNTKRSKVPHIDITATSESKKNQFSYMYM